MDIDTVILSNFKQENLHSFYQEKHSGFLIYGAKQLGADFAFLAEDCVQEAIYSAYEQRYTLDNPFTFKAFIYTCVRNNAISILRKNNSKTDSLSQLENEETDLLNGFIEQETLNLLYKAIEELPERQGLIFGLSFKQALKNKEIAEMIGISESGVKKQKAQIILTLRQILLCKTNNDLAALRGILPLLIGI